MGLKNISPSNRSASVLRDERGVFMLLTAILIITLIGVIGMAIDLFLLLVVQAEGIQRAVNVAAISANTRLYRVTHDPSDTRTDAAKLDDAKSLAELFFMKNIQTLPGKAFTLGDYEKDIKLTYEFGRRFPWIDGSTDASTCSRDGDGEEDPCVDFCNPVANPKDATAMKLTAEIAPYATRFLKVIGIKTATFKVSAVVTLISEGDGWTLSFPMLPNELYKCTEVGGAIS